MFTPSDIESLATALAATLGTAWLATLTAKLFKKARRAFKKARTSKSVLTYISKKSRGLMPPSPPTALGIVDWLAERESKDSVVTTIRQQTNSRVGGRNTKSGIGRMDFSSRRDCAALT